MINGLRQERTRSLEAISVVRKSGDIQHTHTHTHSAQAYSVKMDDYFFVLTRLDGADGGGRAKLAVRKWLGG